METIAAVGQARELAALPNGDLLVGTNGTDVYLVPNAEADGAAGQPVKFASIADAPVQGVAFAPSTCTVYIASQHGVYLATYQDGATSATPTKIGSVRTGSVAPNSDGDIHTTSSVAVAGGKLYVGVGSSCNACTETDPTRATIQQLDLDGSNMATRATRMRNAIGLIANPDTGTLWAGGAGQDNLPLGHPYEYFDAVTLHSGVADYGWPACEENNNPYGSGADCSATVAPIVELPAYATIIGAVFYPASQMGKHAFPAANRGLYLTGHGSWHMTNGTYYTAPRVAYVPMNGDAPATAVDWNDPSKQWSEFVGGFQLADNITRIARPTGIALGKEGSLFVADDQNGRVYRIRPTP
jgi:glucose/arabinose dehydrogenase